jgi:hypothetical protein
MRRLFWLGVGIAVGAVIARQVAKSVEAYSPASLAGSARNSAAGIWESVQDFIADVREGMAEREQEIHTAFERGVSLGELGGEDDEFRDEQWG